MPAIDEFDECNASIRLLIMLLEVNRPLILSEVYEEMRNRYGVGRRMVDSAIQTCMNLGLIDRKMQRVGKNPRPSLFHQLTPKGKKIAEICKKLEDHLMK